MTGKMRRRTSATGGILLNIASSHASPRVDPLLHRITGKHRLGLIPTRIGIPRKTRLRLDGRRTPEVEGGEEMPSWAAVGRGGGVVRSEGTCWFGVLFAQAGFPALGRVENWPD